MNAIRRPVVASSPPDEMVDRVYKGAIPSFRAALRDLKREFSELRPRTDWNRLRVEPLLKHVESLQAILESPRFSQEVSRLTRGTPMFHSDLAYLRENVKALQDVLRREKAASERR